VAEGLITAAVVDVECPEHRPADTDAAGVQLLGAARERVEPYGGTQVAGSDHELVAVFPTPRQALLFAVVVQEVTGAATRGPRIGITTGEDPGGERSDGPVVDAARHLARRATAGEVLVSEAVRHLAGTNRGVRFADRGPLHVGSDATGRVFAASTREADDSAAPVFGREAELEAARWLVAELTGGSGRALVLEGEAGIGKSHLVHVVSRQAAAAGATVLECAGDELEHDRPGRALLVLGDQLHLPVDDLLTDVERLGGSRGFAVIEAVVDAVEDAAVEGPLVIVAEDVHWGDELSLRGIAALCRRVPSLPLAIVVTLRPHPQPASLEALFGSLAGVEHRRLRLGGLDLAAVASIVAAHTGAAPGPVLSSRLAGAAGNPLFVLELINALGDEGALRVAGGVVETTGVGVPATLRETILQRLSFLPHETLQVLRLGSLLGSEFTLADLATVASLSVVDCAARLQGAVRAAVVVGDGDRLKFRHDLIREAIYGELVPAIRQDLHVAAGRALQAAGAPAQQVARQFASGARPGDLNAVEWLERAAREALALDPGAAADLLQRAISLAPSGWAGAARLEATLLEPLAWSGRVEEALARATALLDRAIEPADEFATRRGLAAVLATVGDIDAASAECERAGSVVGAPADQARLLRCVAAGMSIIVSGSPEEVRAAAEGHLEAADRSGDRPLACWSHQALALSALATARYDDALHHARASRRILDAAWVAPMGFLIPHLWEGSALAYLDRFDEGFGAYRTVRNRAQARGEAGLLVLAHAGSGALHYYTGHWDEAVSEIEAGMVLADEAGAQAMTLLSHATLARIALGRGDLEAADRHVAAGLEVTSTIGHRFGLDVLLWAQAGLLEARGEIEAARDLLAELWRQIAPVRFLMQYRSVGPDLIRLARRSGQLDQADQVARHLEAAAQCNSSESSAAAALRGRGLADGDADALLRAVQRYRSTPRRVDLAAACEDAAAELLSAGRGTEAGRLLDEAAAILLDVGAHHDLARIDALARAHGKRRRSHRPATASEGWGALSAKEREVVDLIARGLSNPDIGRQLFISRRTVETHLSHIFKKLGVTNRVQLAAAAVAEASGRESEQGPTVLGVDWQPWVSDRSPPAAR
jgi:DNA-binding CsgD family transcriptional regulator/tetratricopeptide (TPR) repeat protein